MLINQTSFQAPVSRANSAPPPAPTQPAAAAEPNDKIDAFYSGAANTAKWMSRIDGVVLGGVVGLAAGAFVGAAVFGPASFGAAASVAGLAGGGAYVGYQAFDRLSAFGGRIGASADEQNPARGEAIGRVGVNAALSLLSGNWRSAAMDIAVPAVGGAIGYALHSDKR